MESPVTKLILNLALSDLLHSGYSIPLVGTAIYTKVYTEENCASLSWIGVSIMNVSIYNLVLITIHNYLRICHDSIYYKVSQNIFSIHPIKWKIY